jgi:predicted CXXCH cytochrome family protein
MPAVPPQIAKAEEAKSRTRLTAGGQGVGAAGARPRTALRGALPVAASALLAVLCISVPFAVGDGGVFTTTKHGDPATGIQRLTGADYPTGACVQCHSQHASAEGSSTTPYPYALFAPDDNNLCGAAECHADAGANHVYRGLSDYNLSAHATDPAVVWPGPTPWPRRAADQGKCINCHDPHGQADAQGLIPALALAREEKLCLTCHDGSPAYANISGELTKAYAHPVTTVAGRHRVEEGGDPAAFGAGNRHAECADCHNAHDLQHAAVPAAPPDASSELGGVSYIEVFNGAAWTQPTYLYHAADDATRIQYQYQLCFKCHSSWTTLPLTTPSGRAATDKAKELNPNNLSYHPVEAPGKQTTITWPANDLIPPRTATSIISCTDCHAADSPSSPRGPHGSIYRYLLKADYRAEEHRASYASTDYALCFGCHSETALLSTSGPADTNFADHARHLQTAAGDQPYLPTCNSCHGNVHGSDRKRLIDFSQELHLTSFTSWTSKEDGAGIGQCTLVCHGHQHSGAEY